MLPLALACAKSGGEGGGGNGGSGGSVGVSSGDGGSVTCGASETQCGNECVDLDADPNNCGSCGRTCVLPNAVAACSAGECALGGCEAGYANCDDDVDTGCEVEDSCESGAGCTTSCGTIGNIDCSDVCAPVCALPAESCNVADDDCDGECDEGPVADCRIGVYRAHGPNGHFYGTDPAEIQSLGYTLENGGQIYYYLYNELTADLRPFFRCPKGNGQFFFSTATDCEIGMAPAKTVGFIAPLEECGATALYRLSNPGNGAHFYTVSAPERDNAINNLGFNDEGIAGYVWLAP